MKNRNVRFYGLMTAFFLLFCISMCGCITITINECCRGTRMTDERVPPEYPAGRIKGLVKELGTNTPITNASISYSGAGGSGYTSSTPAPLPGYYQTALLEYPCNYSMTITAPGHEGTSTSVYLNASQVWKNIYLKKL